MSSTNSLVRDANFDVIPQQYYDATTAQYKVVANGDTTGVDFSKKTLLRDANFEIIPAQYYDVNVGKFVLGMLSGSGNSGGTTVNVPNASTGQAGKVQLSNAIDSDSQNMASTPLAVKNALTEAKEYADNAVREVNDKILYTKPTKWFVVAVAGQSNAVGYDESPVSDVVSKNLNPNRIRQLGIYDDKNLEIIPLEHHAHSFQDMRSIYNTETPDKKGTKGIHLPLANLILDKIPEDYGVLIVSAAYGGTGFTGGANNGVSDYNSDTMKPNNKNGRYKWGKDSAYFYGLRDRIKFVLDKNTDNIFGGVVWIQGEADVGQATAHKAAFNEMTTEFFRFFNETDGGKYKKQVAKRVWDKDLWYNVETVAHWYTTANCTDIWNGYKEFNIRTYVEIPRTTESNIVNGIMPRKNGTSPAAPPSHFGNDAFTKVIAPRVVQKMIDNNALFNSSLPVISAATSDALKASIYEVTRDLTQSDYQGFGAKSASNIIDNIITFGQDPFGYTSNISFKSARKISFDATQKFYWIAFRGALDGKLVAFCIGDNLVNGLISEVDTTNPDNTTNKVDVGFVDPVGGNYLLQDGDRVSIETKDNGVIVVLLKKRGAADFTIWYELDTTRYAAKYTAPNTPMLGFLFGVSNSRAPLSQYGARKVMKNVKIHEFNAVAIGAPIIGSITYLANDKGDSYSVGATEYRKADGTQVSRANYPELAAFMDATSDENFTLPNITSPTGTFAYVVAKN